MQQIPHPHNEQALIALIVSLENDIECAESARTQRPSSAALNRALRQLRRQRAMYLSLLLDEAHSDEYSLNAA